MNVEQKRFLNAIEVAIKKGDSDAVVSVYILEIGALLRNNKSALIKLVRNEGINIPDTISDLDLSKVISSGLINKKKSFIESLTRLILEQKENYLNIAGLDQIFGFVSKGIEMAGSAIAKAVEKKKQKKEQKLTEAQEKKRKTYELASSIIAASKEKQIAAIAAKKEADIKAQEEEKTKKILMIAGVIMGLSLVSLIVYKATDSNA